MNDEQRMQQRWIRHRDANAFADLVHQHAGMVYATCRRVLNNAADAEDVAQECFLELARTPRLVKPNLGGWLHRVAVSRALNHQRSAKRRQAREERYAREQPGSECAGWDDIKPHLDEAIAALPEKYRVAVIERFLAGKTQEEVAAHLGVPRSTAQYRIDRGVERIRRFLESRGISAAAGVLVAAMDAIAREPAPASLVAGLGERAIAAYPAGAIGRGWLVGKAVVGVGVMALVVGVVVLQRPEAAPGALRQEAPADSASPQTALDAGGDVESALPGADGSTGDGPSVVLSGRDLAANETAVSGFVRTEESAIPLAGFSVMAFPLERPMQGDNEPAAEATTDHRGYYRIAGLEAGDYTLHAIDSAPSYHVMDKDRNDGSRAHRRGGKADLRITAGKSHDVDIAVDVAGCLVGQVVYADERPAAGVRVWARGEDRENKYWAERETDATGRFVFLGLNVGHGLRLQAGTDTRVSPVTELLRLGDADAVSPTIVLARSAAVAGVVLDSQGQPAPGAKVWLRPRDVDIVWPRFMIADEAGQVAEKGLQAGTHDVLLAPVGSQRIDEDTNRWHFYHGTIGRIYPDETPVLTINLRPGEVRSGLRIMARGGEIRGRVVDSGGRPISEASVSIMERTRVETGADGRFILSGLPDDRYVVHASHAEYRPERLEAIPVGARDLEIALERRGVVEGQVVDAKTGQPIPDFELYTSADRPYETWMDRWFETHSNPEGRFTYKPNFVTGRVFARAPGYAVNSALAAEVHADDPPTRITIALARGRSLEGLVVNPSGAAVSGATIYRDTVPASRDRREASELARTGEDGRFTVNALPEEPVTLVAIHERWGYGSVTTATVPPGDPLRIVLSGVGGLAVRVADATGTLEGVPVHAMALPAPETRGTAGFRPSAMETGVTDTTGTCRFDKLPLGPVQVTCAQNGRRRMLNVEVTNATTPVYDIRFLPLTTTLAGSVVAGDGTPVPRGTLTVVVRSEFGDEIFRTEWAEGVYQFEGLPAGSAELILRVGEEIPRRIVAPVTLENDAALAWNISLADTEPIGHPADEGAAARITVHQTPN